MWLIRSDLLKPSHISHASKPGPAVKDTTAKPTYSAEFLLAHFPIKQVADLDGFWRAFGKRVDWRGIMKSLKR
jgi:hypothetical protein